MIDYESVFLYHFVNICNIIPNSANNLPLFKIFYTTFHHSQFYICKTLLEKIYFESTKLINILFIQQQLTQKIVCAKMDHITLNTLHKICMGTKKNSFSQNRIQKHRKVIYTYIYVNSANDLDLFQFITSNTICQR